MSEKPYRAVIIIEELNDGDYQELSRSRHYFASKYWMTEGHEKANDALFEAQNKEWRT